METQKKSINQPTKAGATQTQRRWASREGQSTRCPESLTPLQREVPLVLLKATFSLICFPNAAGIAQKDVIMVLVNYILEGLNH